MPDFTRFQPNKTGICILGWPAYKCGLVELLGKCIVEDYQKYHCWQRFNFEGLNMVFQRFFLSKISEIPHSHQNHISIRYAPYRIGKRVYLTILARLFLEL